MKSLPRREIQARKKLNTPLPSPSHIYPLRLFVYIQLITVRLYMLEYNLVSVLCNAYSLCRFKILLLLV